MARELTLLKREVFDRFVKPGEVIEVRVLGTYQTNPAWGNEFAKGTVSGYFDKFDVFCKSVEAVDQEKHSGIYFTLQVIDPRLIGRAFNRIKPAGATTSDNNIISYRWLPIDIDPVRPAGVSSSEKELAAAWEAAERVTEYLENTRQWLSPILAMSGNGVHLLYRLEDLPVDDTTKQFIKDVLSELSDKFDTDIVKIDQTVFNPSRIWKLYGTTARKGDEVPAGKYREARPHRMSYITSLGEY